MVNGRSVQKRNTSSEWLHHPPSPQGEGKQETRLREASNTMRGWQANKKRIYAPPAILGLCPKLKYPRFHGGIIILKRQDYPEKDKKTHGFMTKNMLFYNSVSLCYNVSYDAVSFSSGIRCMIKN